MKVLVACAQSGTVRDAFADRGHDAWSCDILPSDTPGNHIQGDAVSALKRSWDLVIAHPPCTYLTSTGLRWLYHPEDLHLRIDQRRRHPKFPDRLDQKDAAIAFFMAFVGCAPKWAIENPVGCMSSKYRKPEQIVHPWWFGDDASKATCLWLGGLPALKPTKIVPVTMRVTSTGKSFSQWYWDSSSLKGEERRKMRSKTFQGLASAMASQWG